MEAYLSALNKRQAMLLLTAVTFGGQEALTAFDHLPAAEGELLRQRAQGVLQIPRDKRIPLLVQELKRLVTAKRTQLWAADPQGLAELLLGERPTLVEVVLRALPSHLAQAVGGHLPPRNVQLRRELRPELLNILRVKLEERLAKAAPRRGAFKFSDVLLLQSRELLTLCERLGARALAPALAGLPEASRAAFLDALTPDLRAVTQKAIDAAATRKLGQNEAQEVVAVHDADKHPPLTALRSAGVQRLARACLAQAPDFALRVLERHRGELGGMLARWIREERARSIHRGDGGRADAVAELERLGEEKLVDRPVRLAAPPLRRPDEQARGHAPPPAAPRAPKPWASRAVGGVVGPTRKRDPIAEREARKAGVAPRREVSASDSSPRAKGVLGPPKLARGGAPPAEDRRVRASPITEKPPTRRDGTHPARPAPASERTAKTQESSGGGRRGPKGRSG